MLVPTLTKPLYTSKTLTNIMEPNTLSPAQKRALLNLVNEAVADIGREIQIRGGMYSLTGWKLCPSVAQVRRGATLRILEEKGLIKREFKYGMRQYGNYAGMSPYYIKKTYMSYVAGVTVTEAGLAAVEGF